MWSVTSGTFKVFSHIFESKQRKQVSGIVGVSDVAHQVIGFGARTGRWSCSPWSASRSA